MRRGLIRSLSPICQNKVEPLWTCSQESGGGKQVPAAHSPPRTASCAHSFPPPILAGQPPRAQAFSSYLLRARRQTPTGLTWYCLGEP